MAKLWRFVKGKIWLVAVVCLGAGFLVGFLLPRFQVQSKPIISDEGRVIGAGQLPGQETVGSDVQFQEFWQLWSMLKEKYYEQPIKDKSLFYGAMSGLAASLGDPYTNFFEPKSAADFQSALAGKFEGIGAEIGIKNDQLQIVAPLPGTPAERAGLLSGDAIIKIDGTDTAGMAVEKAVSLIRGPKGTPVTLNIFRVSQKKPPYDVTIKRDEIKIKSVVTKNLPGDLVLLEVTHFNGDTRAEFEAAAKAIIKIEPKGIILDLRNDPGGYLDTSLFVAGAWVGDQVVVKERRQGKIIEELHGLGRAYFKNIPTVVLVNAGSASASEIVAGALQDYGAGTLVGVKTFGKGSVQDYQNFPDGSGVKITVAEWVTPKERAIHKVGLDPDIVVDRTPEDYEKQRDPQLDRAVALLNGGATSTVGAPAATGTAR